MSSQEPPAPDKKAVGLYAKFKNIERTDGQSAPGGKHHGCDYFVLDLTHDPHATAALYAYANSCEAEYPLLARDLRAKLPGHTCDVEPSMPCRGCLLEYAAGQRRPSLPAPPAGETAGCTLCGAKNAGGYEIEDVNGTFCLDCWLELADFFAHHALNILREHGMSAPAGETARERIAELDRVLTYVSQREAAWRDAGEIDLANECANIVTALRAAFGEEQ